MKVRKVMWLLLLAVFFVIVVGYSNTAFADDGDNIVTNTGVVIDNYPAASPQSGIDKAEIVYETAVAPGITRFLAIFDLSKTVEKIGPVRSAREQIVELAAGHSGGFAHAGGSSDSLSMIPSMPIVDLNEIYGAGDYFYRSDDRPMPHNLYTNTELLRQGLLDSGKNPVLPFADFHKGAMSGGSHESEAVVRFTGQSWDTVYRWNELEQCYERYENDQLVLLDNGSPITANNVVVIYTSHKTAFLSDLNEWKVEANIVGSGNAKFYRNNMVWDGNWEKTAIDSQMNFTTDNKPMVFSPGNIWVLVVPDITDTVAPTVISTSPADKETNVPINKNISVIFSENIQQGANFSGIKIYPITPTDVLLNVYVTTAEVGTHFPLIATVLPNTAINKAVNWRTSNPTVATVDNDGEVTAISPGEVCITVTTVEGNKSRTCTVKVISSDSTEPAGGGGGGAATTTSVGINGNVLNIGFNMCSSVTYEVYIPSDAIVDLAGKPLENNYIFTFRTQATKMNYKIFINGKEVQSDIDFYDDNGVLLGPLRPIAEAMGIKVSWNAYNQQIIFSSGNSILVMSLNSTKYTFNGTENVLPVQTMIINDRIVVPLQVVVESFGGSIIVDKIALSVNEVNSNDVILTGVVGKAGLTITVKSNGRTIGSALSLEDGSFAVSIPPQQEGTVLEVTATDQCESSILNITVKPAPLPVDKVNYRVFINGIEVLSDCGFYEYNGVVLGPIRSVTEAMGLISEWNEGNQQITFILGDIFLVMTLNSNECSLNGIDYPLPVQPTLVNDKIIVPLKVVVEVFGGTIRVDKSIVGKYTITPNIDTTYTNGQTTSGIDTMTVNSNVNGLRYFSANITPVVAHIGNEKAVFVQYRGGIQVNLNATGADFDLVNSAIAGFNVQPGDVVKVFIVDDLTNALDFNPTVLE